jgi:hypothetical protein
MPGNKKISKRLADFLHRRIKSKKTKQFLKKAKIYSRAVKYVRTRECVVRRLPLREYMPERGRPRYVREQRVTISSKTRTILNVMASAGKGKKYKNIEVIVEELTAIWVARNYEYLEHPADVQDETLELKACTGYTREEAEAVWLLLRGEKIRGEKSNNGVVSDQQAIAGLRELDARIEESFTKAVQRWRQKKREERENNRRRENGSPKTPADLEANLRQQFPKPVSTDGSKPKS